MLKNKRSTYEKYVESSRRASNQKSQKGRKMIARCLIVRLDPVEDADSLFPKGLQFGERHMLPDDAILNLVVLTAHETVRHSTT